MVACGRASHESLATADVRLLLLRSALKAQVGKQQNQEALVSECALMREGGRGAEVGYIVQHEIHHPNLLWWNLHQFPPLYHKSAQRAPEEDLHQNCLSVPV